MLKRHGSKYQLKTEEKLLNKVAFFGSVEFLFVLGVMSPERKNSRLNQRF
jgi:hypothetical protein